MKHSAKSDSERLAAQIERLWLDSEYDGVKGKIPDWLPQADKSRFFNLRYTLFNAVRRGKFSLDELMDFFHLQLDNNSEWDAGGNVVVTIYNPPNPNLAKHWDDILYLSSLFECVRQGQDICLKLRLGEPLFNDADRGVRVSSGAKAGHVKTHGTPDQKQERWKNLQKEVARIHASHPKWSWEEIKRRAAKNCGGVSTKTIQRRVSNPKKGKS